jgi:hypothetical protein
MSPSRAQRQLATWFAMLAILMASLAPSVSHALGLTRDASWIEVCSAQGARWVKGDSSDSISNESESGSVPAAAHLLDHCPYCSVHMPAWGLPPAHEVAPLALGLEDKLPPAFLAARRTPHAWVTAQPRAPPLFS